MRIGVSAELYRNTATAGTTPTWNRIDNAGDIDQASSAVEADVTNRAGGGFKQTATCLVDEAINFTLLEVAGNASSLADVDYFRNAFQSRALVDVLLCEVSRSTTGARCTRIIGYVTTFPAPYPLGDAVKHAVTVKPGQPSQDGVLPVQYVLGPQ